MDKVAVLIPCYNEALTIEKVIRDYKAVLPEADIDVYDNNSSDGTDEIARAAGAIVRYERRQGKGNVIRSMFREIDADCYLMIDGDDTYPATCAREMADLVLYKQADMVIGDRLSSTYFTENKRPFHNFGNTIVRFAINTLFRSKIRDVMTGCRAFSFDFVKTFPVLSAGFEIETEMTIHALDKNMKIDHVTIPYRDRPAGSVSKLNTVKDGIKVLRTILTLHRNYKPYSFFGIISAILMVLATVFFIPVLITYIQTGLVPNFPTLIVCGFAVIAALLSFFTGLQLQNAVQKNKQDFELSRIRVHWHYKKLIENKDKQNDESYSKLV
jgi:glycosyltransferase involved in cell wall biosynthesis